MLSRAYTNLALETSTNPVLTLQPLKKASTLPTSDPPRSQACSRWVVSSSPMYFQSNRVMIDTTIQKGAVLNEVPTSDDPSTFSFAGSTIVLQAASREEVKEILRKDVYVASGVWDVENVSFAASLPSLGSGDSQRAVPHSVCRVWMLIQGMWIGPNLAVSVRLSPAQVRGGRRGIEVGMRMW